jgi:hypothetical protein
MLWLLVADTAHSCGNVSGPKLKAVAQSWVSVSQLTCGTRTTCTPMCTRRIVESLGTIEPHDDATCSIAHSVAHLGMRCCGIQKE